VDATSFPGLSYFLSWGGREKEGKKRYPGNEVANDCNSTSILLGSANFMPSTVLLQTSSVGCARKPMWSFHLTGKFNHTQEIV